MISIIVCIDNNGGIGKDNKLLFHIKEDMKRFKNLTTGHKVIMGRKTHKSLPNGYLPNRENIILTNNHFLHHEGNIHLTNNIDNLINQYRNSDEEVFIIGGDSIYKQFLPYTNKIYLTKVNDNKNADSYFNFDEKDWKTTSYKLHTTSNGLQYCFYDLIRQ